MLTKKLDFLENVFIMGTMELKKYMKLNEISVSQAARELKKSRTWVSLVVNGRKKPGIALIKRIRLWSDEAVTIKDLRPDLFD